MCPKTLFRLTLLTLLIAQTAFNSASARRFDEIIAYVNDNVITIWELENVVRQRAQELQHTYRFSTREAMEKAKQEQPELLERLIRQMLLVETALTLKIEVTDKEIEQYIQQFKKDAKIETEKEFIEQLKKEGYTLMAFREQSKRNLMADALLMRRILPKLQVRDSEVMKFFEENRSQFTTKTDKVHLKHILIAFKPGEADRQIALQKINSIFQEAKAGKDFEELAQRYSADDQNQGPRASSEAGALIKLPITEFENLSEPFRTALSTLNPGEIGDPIEGKDGIYLFKVEDKADQIIAFRYLVILLKPSEESISKAYERTDVIRQKLEQGEDFETLVGQYSDDLQTKANGGDLGVRSLSELSSETQQVIEKLAVGEYSTPVKMAYGVHIFRVDSRTAPELTEVEKDQIRIMLREQKFREEWQAYTDMLRKHAYVKIKQIE
jgi:peptidyl-prolyl cis-trans isomerase SurA